MKAAQSGPWAGEQWTSDDRLAQQLLAARRELQTIRILPDFVPLTEIGRERLDFALLSIDTALDALRPLIGLASVREKVAA